MNPRLTWALAACCLSLAACSRGSSTTAGDTASCVADTDCATGQSCSDGVCFDKPAVTCTKNADCTGGATCNLLKGVCESTGTGGTGGTGGSGGACTTKYDCPDGQACPSGKCVAPAATCRQDADCARGQICNFSQKCEAGCNPNEPRDCASPKLCHPQKFVCEVCSQTNPCPKSAAGKAQQCFSGTCREATTCTTTQDCVSKGADGAVCKSGVCANCTQLADCNVDPYKGDTATRTPGRICTQAGICQLVTCTDANCKQALGNLGYCDAATSSCQKYGCLTSTDCASTQECNVQQHVCVPKGGCVGSALSTCQSQCQSQSKSCNTATCSCQAASGGGSCAQDSDCGDTTKYGCFSGTCNEKAKSLTGGDCGPLECLLGTLGVPLCTGAATGAACDATACLTGGLSGSGQAAPCVPASGGSGGGSCTPGAGLAGATCSQDGDCKSCKCNSSSPIPIPGLPSSGTCQ